MWQKITLYILFFILFSCSQSKIETDSILEIIEIIKEKEPLKSNPHLILDGFDVFSENFSESSFFLEKNKIGYVKYLNAEQSQNKYKTEYDNGIVIMNTKLWLPEKNEKRKIIYLVNGEEMELDNYKKLKLENIVKKGGD